jgi:hypothetical protein
LLDLPNCCLHWPHEELHLEEETEPEGIASVLVLVPRGLAPHSSFASTLAGYPANTQVSNKSRDHWECKPHALRIFLMNTSHTGTGVDNPPQ